MDFHSFYLVLCRKMRIREGDGMQLYSLLITTLDEVVSITPRLFYPRITSRWSAFVQPLLQLENNNYYIFWVCVFSLSSSMQCACAILSSSVDWPALQYFSTLSHTRHDFRRKKLTEDFFLMFVIPMCLLNIITVYYYYYWYSALGPVWAETRVQSGTWHGSGTLYPGQALRSSLPLLSPAF